MDTMSEYALDRKNLEKIIKEYDYNFNMESLENTLFLVGTSASTNWDMYRHCMQTDTIFHLNKFSSPYVIVNLPINQLSNEQILAAAIICKRKSKYKNVPNVGVIYTPISNTVLGNEIGSFVIRNNHKKKLIIV